ncbi:dolichyl-diphosphooligosaccharide--protein glycosyltransferase [Halogranum gelatinilyticum]|uniref:dolichyl-phosphooligosaccharide-protein glycotransferase n=1 Tax=Halogranum gelatinilyticum TaxID=660521 RepID=A0A1G9X5H7_9EURY|nr:STT3 domain-containing protein [Halogranum gelatinilyticum]SDM91781.1 dolichyl-diphosphooligosaccharide--protein glycosyltransferase [Halogranum gelatinilyticum]
MTDVREATTSLLESHPSMESALRELLELDDDGPWTFQETSLDSGTFGEIVSSGIVEKHDSDYRIADRDAVRAVLNGESTSTGSPDADFGLGNRVKQAWAGVDRNALLLLCGALVLVAALRMVSFPAVFRDGDVVLLGNDPYHYRYWVEQAAAVAGTFDFAGLAELPRRVELGEPLLVATLWFVSSVFGGGTAVTDVVVAVYPVVAAVVVAVCVYRVATSVTDDRRVGLAAVLMLALIPAHAYRSGLGFADHHAFDYLWLALTAVALVELVSDSGRPWPYSALLGVGVAGQILAWDNGPLLVVPIALVVALHGAALVARGTSPLGRLLPIVAGLGLASVLTWGAHTTLGWHTTVVASVPLLLTLGALVVAVLGEAAHRFDVPLAALLGTEAVGAVALAVALPAVFPEFAQGVNRGIDTLFATRNIAETTSIVGEEMGSIFGPLLLFGFVFLLGLPYLGWATLRAARQRDSRWMTLSAYGWWFFALTLVQLRFSGEFSVFLAMFAGVGFLHVAAAVGLADPVELFSDDADSSGRPSHPSDDRDGELALPSRREALTSLSFVGFVGSLSLVQIPVKFSQLTISRDEYRAAVWMRDYAEERDWSYPENYVFSQWGKNRMYNWFVNGEADSYGYAQRRFTSFLEAENPEEWYNRLNGRAGFVVTDVDASDGTIATQLSNYGSETEEAEALSHYRLVHRNDSLLIFTLVAGARLVGESEQGAVTASTEVDVEGETFDYENTVQVASDGTFSVTVPYPGEYHIGDETYVVESEAVVEGSQIRQQR